MKFIGNIVKTTITEGATVLIEGTIMAMSSGNQGSMDNPTARLDSSTVPGTVPCVSAESMSLQMEYLYMQRPIAGIWGNETITGVPVSLDTVDPNGNCIHIADVVTDGYSGTFGYTWTPDVPGQYTVTATFMGDDSYGSSFAQTYVSVVEAPPATATPEPQQAAPDSIPYIIGATVAMILAVAIATILILRKRQ